MDKSREGGPKPVLRIRFDWMAPPVSNKGSLHLQSGFVYKKMGGGGGVALRPTHPKKILSQNVAEGKSSLNKRPFVGPTQTPPPYVSFLINKACLQYITSQIRSFDVTDSVAFFTISALVHSRSKEALHNPPWNSGLTTNGAFGQEGTAAHTFALDLTE